MFRRVAVGIQGNLGFSPQALLIFVYEVLSDSIPQLTSKTKWVWYWKASGHFITATIVGGREGGRVGGWFC